MRMHRQGVKPTETGPTLPRLSKIAGTHLSTKLDLPNAGKRSLIASLWIPSHQVYEVTVREYGLDSKLGR